MSPSEYPPYEEGEATHLQAAPETAESSFDVVVVSGASAGARLRVDADSPRALVGTSPVCELRIVDPLVSRRHLSVEIGPNALLRVVDLASTNGCFLGSARVLDVMLGGGETLRIGDTTLRAERRASPSSKATDSTDERFGNLVGGSRAMKRLYPVLRKLAASNVPLIIEGETGTGKEALAEAIHDEGPRNARPFVVFDCTAVPPTLVESELFGHERGAFTGAVAARKGVFEQADGGTLLIDEIGDLDLALQPKLLRALERGEVRRVGGGGWVRVDVRILVATRRDLDQEVQSGRFRDDLFHRLAVARIELPPLRMRTGDVELLAKYFARKLGVAALPEARMARWVDQPWPGNVRELRNAVARFVALGEHEDDATKGATTIAPEGDLVSAILAENLPLSLAREKLIHAFEGRYVAHTLAANGGNVRAAAEASGVARRYFQLLKARHAR